MADTGPSNGVSGMIGGGSRIFRGRGEFGNPSERSEQHQPSQPFVRRYDGYREWLT